MTRCYKLQPWLVTHRDSECCLMIDIPWQLSWLSANDAWWVASPWFFYALWLVGDAQWWVSLVTKSLPADKPNEEVDTKAEDETQLTSTLWSRAITCHFLGKINRSDLLRQAIDIVWEDVCQSDGRRWRLWRDKDGRLLRMIFHPTFVVESTIDFDDCWLKVIH